MKISAEARLTRKIFSLVAFLIVLVLGASRVHAQVSGLTDFEVSRQVMSALQANPKYMGLKTGWVDQGQGTFCRKETSWSYAWEAELEDAVLTLKPDEKAIDLVLRFRKVAIEGSGFRTGGILCAPMGGSGRARLDDFYAMLRINKKTANVTDKPLIEVQALKLKGLKIDRVNIAIPFFYVLNGEAPDWLND